LVPRRIMSVLQKKRVTRVCVAHGHSAVVTDEGHLFTFGKTLLPLSLPHNPPPQGSSICLKAKENLANLAMATKRRAAIRRESEGPWMIKL